MIGLVALAALLAACAPDAPPAEPQLVAHFEVGRDTPIEQDAVRVDADAWLVVPGEARSVRLFEVDLPPEKGAPSGAQRLDYRARLASAGLRGRAYLEMWVRLPGRGMFFSRGLAQPLQGTMGWATYEIPFLLQAGERPDQVLLNVVFEDPAGRVSIKDVELFRTASGG